MKLMTCFAMLSMLALAIPACTAEAPDESDEVLDGDEAVAEEVGDGSGDEGDVNNIGEAEQAVEGCVWHDVLHYGYSVNGAAWRWDVSYNYSTGNYYIDEWKVNYRPSTYKQYRLTPDWTVCWSPNNPNESITLKHGGTTMNGIHNCLPDGREEAHLPDQQRVLSRAYPGGAPFYEHLCL